jgi:hypothetical protein
MMMTAADRLAITGEGANGSKRVSKPVRVGRQPIMPHISCFGSFAGTALGSVKGKIRRQLCSVLAAAVMPSLMASASLRRNFH